MKSYKYYFVIIPLFFITNLTLAQYTKILNLDYVGLGDTSQFLDMYVPDILSEQVPLIVFIHGGQWRGGDKNLAKKWIDTLLNHPFVIASINYRLSTEALFPAQIMDCKAAIRWLKANASTFNIDTSKVAVMGTSSGGHLAALVGTSMGVDSLEDLTQGNAEFTSNVMAVVDLFGPTEMLRNDIYQISTCSDPLSFNDADSPPSALIGCPIQECPEKVKAVDPVTYLDKSDPPFFILHGDQDCSVSPFESIYMDSALDANFMYSDFSLTPGLGHGDDEGWQTPEMKMKILDFLNEAFNGTLSDTNNEPTIPSDFLFPAYPNPFNSTTTIEYQISKYGNVRITVFDILGREVTTLVDSPRSKGTYKTLFDATGLASGIYLFTLTTDNFFESKKLILMK